MEKEKEEQNNSTEKGHSFLIGGLSCASCVARVEKSLKNVPGVSYVSVNLATEKAYVLAEADVTDSQLVKAVDHAGYKYRKPEPGSDPVEEGFVRWRRNMWISLGVTLPLMLLMIIEMFVVPVPYFVWIETVLAGFVFAYSGRGVIRGAIIALIHKHTNMDTLVMLGAFSAWLTAPLAAAGAGIASFGTVGAMIIAFHVSGRYIEARLKRKASTEIRALLELKSDTAMVLQDDGSTEEIPVDSVKTGASVQVRTGERVPLDGVVKSGEASVDESMITGESMPVRRKEGDELVGGSLLLQGAVVIEVEKTGEDTFLSQMVRLVEEAQSSRVPIQALADKITRYFVPIIFFIALAVGLVWGLAFDGLKPFFERLAELLPWVRTEGVGPLSRGLFVFVTVLVIACPCALGLAIPMALVTGSGAAAKKGLLIKSGEAIQSVRSATSLFLDKTGTITEGRPKVVGWDLPGEIVPLVGALESYSTHPLAKGIVDFAESRERENTTKPRVENTEETAGEGISGEVDGQRILVGRPLDPGVYSDAAPSGSTVVEVRRGKRGLEERTGFIALSDPVKPGAAEGIEKLSRLGIEITMLTGDEEEAAAAAAREVGITTWISRVRPDEKVNYIREKQKKGEITVMVGDGINDAAVLKAADTGIAVGNGTDLAIDSADIIIIDGDLSKTAEAVSVSRGVFKTIRQNLFWAFLYNLIAVPLAVSGVLHPAIAEGAMVLSSITVVANSLRLGKRLD